jgi:hypothetical protein
MHAEPLGPRSHGKLAVVRCERQSVELVAHEQGARQMASTSSSPRRSRARSIVRRHSSLMSSLDTAVVILGQIRRRPGSPSTTRSRTDEST